MYILWEEKDKYIYIYIHMKETCVMAYSIGWSLSLLSQLSLKIIKKIDN